MALARNVSVSTCTVSSPVRVRNKIARHADVVAQVEQLVERESLLAHRVEPHVDLQPRALLLQRRKSRLALRANGHDAAGHGHRLALGLKLFAGRLVPLGAHLGQRSRRCALRGGNRLGYADCPSFAIFFSFSRALIKELALEFRFELHTSFSGQSFFEFDGRSNRQYTGS